MNCRLRYIIKASSISFRVHPRNITKYQYHNVILSGFGWTFPRELISASVPRMTGSPLSNRRRMREPFLYSFCICRMQISFPHLHVPTRSPVSQSVSPPDRIGGLWSAGSFPQRGLSFPQRGLSFTAAFSHSLIPERLPGPGQPASHSGGSNGSRVHRVN